jgi:outer membrane protein TolC
MVTLLRLGTLLAAALGAPPVPTAPGAPAAAPAPAVAGSALLTLEEALAQLDERSLVIQQARARSDEASALVRQATAPLLPTLGANGTYTRNSDERRLNLPPAMGGGEIVMQATQQWSAGGQLRVPLVVPSSWWDLAAAREGARAAEASAAAARSQVRAAFVAAAQLAAAAEEVLVASERAVESAAEHERSAQRRVAAGTSPPLDHLRAQTERIRRESDLAKARAELDRSRLSLGILLGRDAPVRVTVPAAEPGAPAAAPLVEQALERRPELSAVRAQAEAARAQLDSARARVAPQLSGTVAAFVSDVPYVTGETTGWRATLDLTWALYDGGFRYGKRRQAEAQLSAAAASAEGARLQVIQEVQDAARDVAVASERLRLAEQQRKLAADAQGSARRSFEAGVASSLDVVDANDRLYQADVGLAEARARLGIARATLARASGEG